MLVLMADQSSSVWVTLINPNHRVLRYFSGTPLDDCNQISTYYGFRGLLANVGTGKCIQLLKPNLVRHQLVYGVAGHDTAPSLIRYSVPIRKNIYCS